VVGYPALESEFHHHVLHLQRLSLEEDAEKRSGPIELGRGGKARVQFPYEPLLFVRLYATVCTIYIVILVFLLLPGNDFHSYR
jgi:hypothetical protein